MFTYFDLCWLVDAMFTTADSYWHKLTLVDLCWLMLNFDLCWPVLNFFCLILTLTYMDSFKLSWTYVEVCRPMSTCFVWHSMMKSTPRAVPCKRCSRQSDIWLKKIENWRMAGKFGKSFLAKLHLIFISPYVLKCTLHELTILLWSFKAVDTLKLKS